MERRSFAKTRSPPKRTVANHVLETQVISRDRESTPLHLRFYRDRQIREVRPPTRQSLNQSARGMHSFGLMRSDSVRPRYPNYLPEMKARRAVVTRLTHEHHRAPSPIRPDTRDSINETLRDALNITDTRIVPYNPYIASQGQSLVIPPEKFTLNYPRVLLSLFRTPEEKVTEWESGTPMIQLDNMRHGQAVVPNISQLPSPDSSHAVLLSIRGRNHVHQNPDAKL